MKISGNIIDVFNKEIYKGHIIIEGEYIKDLVKGDNDEDKYILPGLIDSHIHIESSMLVPSAFAEAAVRHGTVAVVSDPHEIANIMGVKGIDFMIENGKEVPLKFYFGAPSCVPATDFETSGAVVDSEAIEELLKRDDIKYLSEMMNFPAVIADDPNVLRKIESANELGKPVDGHAPGLRGADLEKYIGKGISTDHECIDIDEAREKIKKGMKVQIREGSAARALDRFHTLIVENKDMLMLCSDDLHPEMLYKGHINILVKRLLNMGYDLFDILSIAIVNPVEHYGLDTGILRPGDKADFIIINEPEHFDIRETWIDGRKVYDGTDVLFKTPEISTINHFNASAISSEDIVINKKGDIARVIEAYDGDLFTGAIQWQPDPGSKVINPSPDEDILKIIVKDRYMDSDPAVALIKGFGIKRGAFASSVAHDSHNIIAVGADDESICRAVNSVIHTKGGLSVYDGIELRSLALPVAGIMTDVPCGTIASEYQKLSDYVKDMGCKLKSPFMTLAFMALLVIPELKIGDRGLFDVNKFQFVDLFV